MVAGEGKERRDFGILMCEDLNELGEDLRDLNLFYVRSSDLM